MVAEERGILKRSAGGGDLSEERLHLTCGGEGDDHLAGAVADAGPDVREVAGGADGVAGVEVEALASDLGDELAFEDVEGFVLVGVDVEGWAAAFGHVVLNHEEVALAVVGEYFEGHGAVAHGVHLAGAVRVGEDWGDRFDCGRGLRLRRHSGLAEGGGRDGARGEGEEGTTVHGDSEEGTEYGAGWLGEYSKLREV